MKKGNTLSTVKPVCRKIILAVVWLVWSAGVTAQTPKYFAINGRKINIVSFNEQVNRLMDEVGVPGISLAVIDNNQVVYHNAYGYKRISPKEKNDTSTVFEACSLSKNFLAFAVYKLVDEGKLDLDIPMYQYLDYPQLKHDARYKLITPRMILSHCSGLENWTGFNNPDTLDILSDPGKKYIYSGEGYQYLALVVESLVHKPYKDYMEDMVYQPLGLKRTFSCFTPDGKYPGNYAFGYNAFEKEFEKFRNTYTLPAAGIHVTAKDYATLVVSLFNNKYLSANRVKDILTPVIQTDDRSAAVFYGPGFLLLFNGKDTIVAHGGSYNGFKNFMFYSVVNKRGFVLMTNSDLGKAITQKIGEIAAGMDLTAFFKTDYYEQYPCTAIKLLKVYREKNADVMFAEIERLKKVKSKDLNNNALNELGDRFWELDKNIAVRLLNESIKLNPGSAQAYFLLGEIQMELNEYQLAYNNLKKALELNVHEDGVEFDLLKCEKELNKQKAKL